MKKIILLGLIFSALTAASQLAVIYPENASVPDSMVLDLVRQIDDAWNSRDVEWFSSLFTDDCDLHYITFGSVIHGKEEVRQYYTKSFQNKTPEIMHLTTPGEIIWLSKELVMGTGYTRIVSDPGDGSPQKLIYFHNGMMIFRVTAEGLKVQLFRVWTEEPRAEP
jgi:uncharacterized protein (TIGR02246 family)